MILVRTGPRILFLGAVAEENLRNGLITKLGGLEKHFAGALEVAGESDTIISVTPVDRENALDGSSPVIFIPLGSSVILSEIINRGLVEFISRVSLGPGLLLQRLPEGGVGVIDIIARDYQATGMGFTEAICRGGPGDTVIGFAMRPLGGQIRTADMLEQALLVPQLVPLVYRDLRREAVRYFTEAMGTRGWYDLRINIYDADEYYKIHAQRLALVLKDLEAGFILGESWTRDHALALLSVTAYQVRLFTTTDPLELKKILVSLEFNEQGQRFVDMDLYYRRHKISWSDVAGKLHGEKKPRWAMRQELYAMLSPDTVARLLELERSLNG